MFTKHPTPSHLLHWHQNWKRSSYGLWNTNFYCQVPFLKWKKFFGPENNQSTEVDRFLSIVLWTTWISYCCPAFAFGLLSLEQCRAIKIFFFRARWWVSVTMRQWPQVSTCGDQSSSQLENIVSYAFEGFVKMDQEEAWVRFCNQWISESAL